MWKEFREYRQLVMGAWAGPLMNNARFGAAFFGTGALAGVPMATIGVFVAAYCVFCRGEVLGIAATRRMARPLLVVTLVVMILGAAPATYAGLSPDGRRFVYARCTGFDRPMTGRVEVRVRDLQTGEDERFAVMNGYSPGREVFLSPGGNRLLFYMRRGAARGATWLVPYQNVDSPDPPAVKPDFVAAGMFPIGWLDNDNAVLVRDAPADIAINVVNVTTNSIRRVYPRQ